MEQRLYVLVRNDLTPGQQIAQVTHAVEILAWSTAHLETFANAGAPPHTVVALSVRNEWELKLWAKKMEMTNIYYATFKEPDMNGSMTAIAAYHDGNFFSKLPLI